jgi:hypothetical protein
MVCGWLAGGECPMAHILVVDDDDWKCFRGASPI